MWGINGALREIESKWLDGIHREPSSRHEGWGYRVQGSGFRVQGSGYRMQGSGCRVEGVLEGSDALEAPRPGGHRDVVSRPVLGFPAPE